MKVNNQNKWEYERYELNEQHNHVRGWIRYWEQKNTS